MKTKDLKINFRYLGENIACLSVDSVDGKIVHNDIDNEEAIIIFNSLMGEKENCQNVKTLLKENQELKKQLEERNIEYFKGVYDTNDKHYTQQKEFIKYLEDEIKSCEAVSDLLFNANKEMKIYKQILQKFKEMIGVEK